MTPSETQEIKPLRPCPFCGFNKCEFINPLNGTSPYVSCDKCHADFYAVSWNSAYCWKKIEELEKELATVKELSELRFQSLCKEQERNWKLEQKIKSLEEEVSISDKLIKERNSLLDAVPCKDHGRCIPGAIEKFMWMEKTIHELTNLVKTQQEKLKEAVQQMEINARQRDELEKGLH